MSVLWDWESTFNLYKSPVVVKSYIMQLNLVVGILVFALNYFFLKEGS